MMTKIARLLCLLVFCIFVSCTNYAEINESLDTMRSIMRDTEENFDLLYGKLIKEIETMIIIIEAQRDASILNLELHEAVPTSDSFISA